jgi:hypothetical protein
MARHEAEMAMQELRVLDEEVVRVPTSRCAVGESWSTRWPAAAAASAQGNHHRSAQPGVDSAGGPHMSWQSLALAQSARPICVFF